MVIMKKEEDFLYKLYYRKGTTALCIKKIKHQKTLDIISNHWGQLMDNYREENINRAVKFKGRFLERTAPTERDISVYFIKEEQWMDITKELGVPDNKTLLIYIGSSNRPFFKYELKQEEKES